MQDYDVTVETLDSEGNVTRSRTITVHDCVDFGQALLEAITFVEELPWDNAPISDDTVVGALWHALDVATQSKLDSASYFDVM